MNRREFEDFQKDLRAVFEAADADPAKDTIANVTEKFRRHGFRHLMLNVNDSGLFFLCADPVMSKQVEDAIEKIDEELESNILVDSEFGADQDERKAC